MKFRPQLFPNKQVDPEDMKYPLVASYKLDGIRAIIHNGEIYSRSWKPIPNKQISQGSTQVVLQLSLVYPEWYFDGELFSQTLSFQEICSQVMSHDVKPDESLQFWLFDVFVPEEKDANYMERQSVLTAFSRRYNLPTPDRFHCNQPRDVTVAMDYALEAGYEGLILNAPDAPYKCGRITIPSGNGYKLKPYRTFDSKIVGVTQATVVDPNAEKKINELGYSETSNKKGDRVPIEKAACFTVEWEDTTVDVVLAMTDEEKELVWANREDYVGKVVEWKGMLVGAKDKPRHPFTIRMRPDKEEEL